MSAQTLAGNIWQRQTRTALALSLSLCLASASIGISALDADAQPQPSPVQTDATSTSAYSRPAKEFKYRKRFIAPSSDLYHRIDYASMPSRDSLMLPTYEPTYGKAPNPHLPNGNRPALNYQPIHPDDPQEALKAHTESLNSKSNNIKPMVNRDGLTPPAAPANKNLLPQSLNQAAPTGKSTPISSSVGSTNPEGVAQVAHLSASRIAHIKAQTDALARQGHLGEAQELLARTVQEHPHEQVLRAQLSKISLDRARGFSKQGKAQEAASQARLAIAYGSAYSNASESAYALLTSSLTRAGVDPHNPDARAGLGANLLAANKPIEAEIEYRQAIKLRPTADYYIGAGTAAQAGGNKTSAKFDYQKALELQPDSQGALSKLGQLRYQMHDYVGANADLTRALVINGQDTQAAQSLIDLWQKQVASRPTDAGSHLGLARAYQVTGDLDSAKGEYKTVVKLDPKHPNLPAARQSFKLALARREAFKSFDAAHSLETQGQLSQAYQKASDAVELYPSENNFQSYKTQLAGQLQAAGMPVYAASGQATQALSQLVQQGGATAAGAAAGLLGASTGGASNLAAAPQSAAQAQMAADNMYRPLTTDNHVNSMSGFLSSLRNFTMQQQAQQQSYESAASQNIASIAGVAPQSGSLSAGLGGLPGELPAAANLNGIPGFAPSSPLPNAAMATTPVGSSLDQGLMVGRSRGPVTAASALQAAAQALGNTKNGFPGLPGSAATDINVGSTLGNSFNAGLGAVAGSATSAPLGTAPAGFGASMGSAMGTAIGDGAMSAAPSIASTMIGGMGRAASYLHKNNPQTQTQATGSIEQNAQGAGSLNYGFTPSGNFATNQTMPTVTTQRTVYPAAFNSLSGAPTATASPGGAVATAQSLAVTPEANQSNVNWPQPQPLGDAQDASKAAVNLAPSPSAAAAATTASNVAAIGDPTSNATALALAPPIVPIPVNGASGVMPGGDLAGQAGAAPQTPLRALIPPGAVKLYLTGVKAGKSEVQLQVSLRNDGPTLLKLPSSLKAVVRTSGHPDQNARVAFDSKSVASGGTTTGTIRVPGKSLDPTADVVIPTASLTSGAIADIHLSVPISAK